MGLRLVRQRWRVSVRGTGRLMSTHLNESLPSSCSPQSRLDIPQVLFEVSMECGETRWLSSLAATRSLSTLHRGDLQIMSASEVFVRTHRWCL